MNELYKIGEAKYFLEKMEESIPDRRAFRYNLSAFLSAARSVLQYAMKESWGKGRIDWYDDTVVEYEALKFFRDKRDVNIHGEPIKPSMDISITPAPAICVVNVYSPVVFVSRDGRATPVQSNEEQATPRKEEHRPPTSPENSSQTMIRYRFDDWPGPDDVVGLSRRYVDELDQFVQKGIAEGVLSG